VEGCDQEGVDAEGVGQEGVDAKRVDQVGVDAKRVDQVGVYQVGIVKRIVTGTRIAKVGVRIVKVGVGIVGTVKKAARVNNQKERFAVLLGRAPAASRRKTD
jgi:hypothetical protein